MAVFTSKINNKSDLFSKNRDDFTKLIKKMEDIHSRAEKVSERRRSKFIEKGQLTPRERLSKLLDKDEIFIELFNMINFLVDDDNHDTSVSGGSIIAGIGFVCGVRCLVFIDDSGINAGALIPCKLCNPPKRIGLYRTLIEAFFSIFLISLCARNEYGLIKSK